MATVKLSEKPIVETIGDSDHVIAEVGGNVRRVPASALMPSVPVIDLVSLGVVLGTEQNQYVDIPENIGEQLQQAAMSGGAIIKIGYSLEGIPVPIQSYFNGSGSSALSMYQLRSKFWIGEAAGAYLSMTSKKTQLQVTLLPEGIAEIDLTAAGVVLAPDKPFQAFSIDVDLSEQIVQAATAGAAIVKSKFLVSPGTAVPVQAYCTGAAMEPQFQLTCRIFFNEWFSMAIGLDVGTPTALALFISRDQPIPAPGNDGDFLRAKGGEWISTAVPNAEEASF